MRKRTPKPFVFVLMPIAPEFDDIYELGIKVACQNAGAYAERVDEQIFKESILDRIYNQIDKADVVVADMTGRNPNVFYEVGYAHALGKPVILLTQNVQDIPFDLKHYSHIVYRGRIGDLLKDLQKRVMWAIEQPNSKLMYEDLRFYIHGVEIADNPVIYYDTKSRTLSRLRLQIDIHNSDDNFAQSVNFRLALASSNLFYKSSTFEGKRIDIARTPAGGLIHVIKQRLVILPGAWETCGIYMTIASSEYYLEDGNKESFRIILSLNTGSKNYPFDLVIRYQEPEGK